MVHVYKTCTSYTHPSQRFKFCSMDRKRPAKSPALIVKIGDAAAQINRHQDLRSTAKKSEPSSVPAQPVGQFLRLRFMAVLSGN